MLSQGFASEGPATRNQIRSIAQQPITTLRTNDDPTRIQTPIMTSVRSLLLSFSIILAIAQGHAATWHVSPMGSDTQVGSESNPWRTVQKGLDVAQPGDTIFLHPGDYPDIATTSRNGTPSARITIDGTHAAVVGRLILNHSYISAQNITIRGRPSAHVSLVYLRRPASHTILSNLVVDPMQTLKVTAIGWESPALKPFGPAANNCLIISNRVTGVMASTGLSIFGERNVIKGNRVHDLGQADFVRLWGRSNLLHGNVFTNIFKVPNVGNHIDFIQTFGNNGHGSWGHVIERNLIVDIQGGQLSQLEGNGLTTIGNWIFRNNVFARIAASASCTIPNIQYYNNVFYKCNYEVGGFALNFGSRSYSTLNVTNYAHGTRVLNNVFLDCGNDTSITKGWYAMNPGITNVLADFNFVAKNNYTAVREDTSLRSVGDPEGWDSFRWYEANGINGGDPEFFNPENLDFRIHASSFLLGNGKALPQVFDDFLGQIRTYPPGIGAFTLSEASQVPGISPPPPKNLTILND